MTLIYDQIAVREIIRITCSILKYNFFYDHLDLQNFVDTFTHEMAQDLARFERYADPYTVKDLHTNPLKRLHFTIYYTSLHIRDIFINKLHFSEQEIELFENILPKYTGESHEQKTNLYSK